VKVSDVIEQLSRMNPDDEVVLRHLGSRSFETMKKIRVYKSQNRVIIDGYERETHESR
jgi:hypothetical protein